jgi:hypothetical protein
MTADDHVSLVESLRREMAPSGIAFGPRRPPMPSKSSFSKEQEEEISDLLSRAVNAALGVANANANKTARMVAESERARLAGLIEDFVPITGTEHDDVLVPKGETVDWGKSLKALADAIRIGRHE